MDATCANKNFVKSIDFSGFRIDYWLAGWLDCVPRIILVTSFERVIGYFFFVVHWITHV